MHLDSELIEELNLLMRFGRDASSEAMEIYPNSDQAMIAAAARLFAKGLISQRDGGRLTDTGLEAAECMSRLANLVAPPLEPI